MRNSHHPHRHMRADRGRGMPFDQPEAGFGDDRRHGHRHRGGRIARVLEHGDLRLLVLHLIREKPRHGYELIKAIEELAGGQYAPSPGVVYPTLTLLEELGQAQSTAEGARKLFEITPAGLEILAEQDKTIVDLLARIQATRPREPDAPVVRAGENLRTAIRLKLGGERSPALIRKIADIMDAAAREIEELAL